MNLPLNLNVSGMDTANAQLKQIADAVKQVAGTTQLSAAALGQIRQALGQNTQQANEFSAAVQQLTDNLVGIRTGIDNLTELQGEANAAKERLAGASKEAAKLRQELSEQKKALEQLKQSQTTITQVFTNPLQAAEKGLLSFTTRLGAIPAMIGAVTVGFATLAAGAFELEKKFGSDAREAENLANRLGLTTAQAMKLRAEAELVEVNIHTVEFAARQLSGALEDPTGSGKKAAEALERLGIGLRDVDGSSRQLGPVFLEVLERLSQVKSASERVREAQVLLGRSAKELEPLIVNHKMLEEAIQRLRLHMDDATTKSLLDANMKVNSLTQALKDLGRQMAVKIGPLIIPIIESVTRMVQEEPTGAALVNKAKTQGLDKAVGATDHRDRPDPVLGGRGFGPIKAAPGAPQAAFDQLGLKGSPTPFDTAGEKGLSDAIAQGKAIAADTIKKYRKTADGMREELKELHTEREKLLNELKETEKYGGLPGASEKKSKRLAEIEAREAQIEASLKPKYHDQAKEKMIAIEHERARLSLEVNEAYWRKLHVEDEEGIKTRAANLQKFNKAIADDEVKEAKQKLALLDKSDKDYAIHKATLELQIAKIETRTAERSVEIETEKDNRIKEIHERQRESLDKFLEHTEKQWIESQEKIVKAEGERLKKEARVKEERESNARRHNDNMVRIEEEKIDFLANIGVISEKERTRRLNELYRKQEEDDIRHIQNMIEIEKANPLADPEKITKLEGQLQQVMDRRQERSMKADEQLLSDKVRRWDRAMNNIGNVFDQTVQGMVMRGEGFGVAWRKVVGNMVTDFEVGLIKMGLNWVKHQVAKIILHQSANAAINASDAQSAAVRNSISLREHFREVLRTAKRVAIKAYEALAHVPIIGPTVLGPAAAAASFAAVMAMGAISAEKGAVLPNKDTMAFLHPNEMVLPAPISQGLQAAIAGGGFSNGMAGGAGGFVFAPKVQAFDSRGVDRVLMEHGRKFLEFFNQMKRDGHV